MQETNKKIIADQISPKVSSGEISLLLGAGFSINNSNGETTIPGTCAHGLRVPAKQRCSIQYPGHVFTGNTKVHRDLHAFMAEVIGYGEVLQTPPAREAVAHEIHAPDLVERARQLQRHPLVDRALALLASAHSQVGLSVEAVHALVVDPGKFRAQQIVDAPVAESATDLGDLDDLAGEVLGHRVGLRWMAVAVAGEPHKATGAAFGQVVFDHQFADRFALGLWG